MRFVPNATGLCRDNAYWLARAAELAYQTEATVRKNLEGFGRIDAVWDVTWLDSEGTQAFVAECDDVCIVAFRGTEAPTVTTVLRWVWAKIRGLEQGANPFDDLLVDAKIRRRVACFGNGTRIHRGFAASLDCVWPELITTLRGVSQRGKPIWITGHSLGAALAIAAAGRCAFNGVRVQGVYAIAAPRVYNRAGTGAYNVLVPNTWRFVNNRDVVCRIPIPLRYWHVARERVVWFDRHGCPTVKAGWRQWIRRAVAWYVGRTDVSDHAAYNYTYQISQFARE